MEDLYYIISLLLVFLMTIFNKLHIPSNMATSRRYYVAYFIITLLIFIVFSFVFNIFVTIESDNLINNIVTIQYFYLLITIISLYITSRSKDYADITNIVIFVITILVIIFNSFEKPEDSKSYVQLLILLFIMIIMIIITITNQFFKKNIMSNFFNMEKYGYLCPKNNFKDVVLGETSHLICPID